ncbi:MAG: ATP-binding protein, partial [Spirochaetaceae bacterium]|nr:ATP-binding protein [Spirochaetaceae bacterium]
MKPVIAAALADIHGLILFCRDKPVITAFASLLERFMEEPAPHERDIVAAWASFLRTLARTGERSLYHAVAAAARVDDNLFTRALESSGKTDLSNASADSPEKDPDIPPLLLAFGKADLSRLGRIAGFDLGSLGAFLAKRLERAGFADLARNTASESRALSGSAGPFPDIFPAGSDWARSLPRFAAVIHAQGAGELGICHVFRWDRGESTLKPVRNADTVRLADLAGYGEQRRTVVENTLRFLAGYRANNLLLYGDRGTGKSATVKAVCGEYADRGLRLIEAAKQDLSCLPAILEALSSRALRFILFIDDLSFESADKSFTALKMVLEGGVGAKPPNVAVYATSNRRHFVKERLSDRPTASLAASGDMRAFDSMQEQFSLADRFGVTVVFTAPAQEEFLRIAEYIAERRGLLSASADEDSRRRFRADALRWERWFNGCSPRTAA